MNGSGDGQERPWLTVVTVVKDDPQGLERTTSSLLAQALEGTEWIVIDSSVAPEVVRATVNNAGHPSAEYVWVQPRGVYPAMNEGLARANGEYVHFLNAGDVYAEPDVVSILATVLAEGGVTWLFGQVAFVSTSGREVIPAQFDYRAEQSACFSRGRFPPHQGTIASTAALRRVGGFDESYGIVADYAAALRLSLVADPLELVTVIARFYEGGISTTRWRESIREFHRARVSILNPTGVTAARERLWTTAQFAKVAVARMLKRQRWDA